MSATTTCNKAEGKCRIRKDEAGVNSRRRGRRKIRVFESAKALCCMCNKTMLTARSRDAKCKSDAPSGCRDRKEGKVTKGMYIYFAELPLQLANVN